MTSESKNPMKNTGFLKLICLLIFAVIIFAACTIPFYFESPSIYYKTGIDKLMLRTGKILGIITAVLLLFQPVFVGRFTKLDKIFTLKKLFQYHKTNGLVVLGTAIIHPILILRADHFVFFSFEFRYWPEFIGIFLLIGLIPFVVISFFQKKLGLNYKTWKILHKIIAPIILILMFIHVNNVSRSFESGLPFYLLCGAGLITIFLFVRKALS